MQRAKWVLGGLVVALLAVLVTSQIYPLMKKNFELTRPKISGAAELRGMSAQTKEIVFNVSDAPSGLCSVVIELDQAGQKTLLFRKAYEDVYETSIRLQVEQFREKLSEGDARFTVRAQDCTLWGNLTERVFTYGVDTALPILDAQPSALPPLRGASHVLIYGAHDSNLFKSGMALDKHDYLGTPAASVDPRFASADLFVLVLPVLSKTPLAGVLFAEDYVGNRVEVSLSFSSELTAGAQKNVGLSAEFMSGNLKRLAQAQLGLLQAKIKLSRDEYNRAFLPKTEKEEVLEKFKLLHTKLRPLNDETINNLFMSEKFGAGFHDQFACPAGSPFAKFGDSLRYVYDNDSLGTQESHGLFIRTGVVGQKVYAANGGSVIFAGDDGVYGYTLVIDHGLGITSRYSHLRATAAAEGAVVRRGDVIGFSGDSGLAPFPLIYFEMRVHGQAIDPNEWCNAGEFYQRYTMRLDEVRKKLGLDVEFPLEFKLKH